MLDQDTPGIGGRSGADIAARMAAATRTVSHDSGVQVAVIDTYEAFAALKPGWRTLESRDPEGTVFLSWDWLNAAFRTAQGQWRVLVAYGPQRSLGPVCVLPLRLRVHWSRSRSEFQTEYQAGGRLLYSEYTGFLCDPAFEDTAVPAIAHRLQSLPWSALSLRYEASRNRAAVFTQAFAANDYDVAFKPYRINGGTVDNLLCPHVPLPESFETWLQTMPSPNTRQKIRRFTRRFLATGDWRITFATRDTFERDVDILLRFWLDKWTPVKGAEQAAAVAANYRLILTTALGLDRLLLPVLWQGDVPLGALGHVVDHDMDRVHFIVAGRDAGVVAGRDIGQVAGRDQASDPERAHDEDADRDATSDADGDPAEARGSGVQSGAVGLLLHAHSIRWAIENGFADYDFCHGNEPYKYSYGARDVPVRYVSVRRKALRRGAALDRLCLPEALERVQTFLQEDKADRALAGVTQLARLARPAS